MILIRMWCVRYWSCLTLCDIYSPQGQACGLVRNVVSHDKNDRPCLCHAPQSELRASAALSAAQVSPKRRTANCAVCASVPPKGKVRRAGGAWRLAACARGTFLRTRAAHSTYQLGPAHVAYLVVPYTRGTRVLETAYGDDITLALLPPPQ